MIIELEKINELEVLYDGIKLPIVDKNKPCGPSVDLGKLGLNGYQRYIKISKLEEGPNQVELKEAKETTKQYSLTIEEKKEIEQLENRIKEIKENAKKRFIPKATKIEDMDETQLQDYIEKCNKLLENLKAKV